MRCPYSKWQKTQQKSLLATAASFCTPAIGLQPALRINWPTAEFPSETLYFFDKLYQKFTKIE
ncbi:hypothetical protein QUB70_24315 [Microcoleus sp. A003_D6]